MCYGEMRDDCVVCSKLFMCVLEVCEWCVCVECVL